MVFLIMVWWFFWGSSFFVFRAYPVLFFVFPSLFLSFLLFSRYSLSMQIRSHRMLWGSLASHRFSLAFLLLFLFSCAFLSFSSPWRPYGPTVWQDLVCNLSGAITVIVCPGREWSPVELWPHLQWDPGARWRGQSSHRDGCHELKDRAIGLRWDLFIGFPSCFMWFSLLSEVLRVLKSRDQAAIRFFHEFSSFVHWFLMFSYVFL